MAADLNWGILGTGGIAKAFARGVAESATGRLVAVGSRSQKSAEEFAAQFNVPHRHGSYETLLADPQVHAVYISTPHPCHKEWAIKSAEAGKHILCEKPIGVNAAEASAMIDAARRHDVFLMEAFMYRCHPQTHRLVELLRQKVIGDVRAIQATFSFAVPFDASSRLLSNDLAGGGILDVGCYPVSMARLVAGVANGRNFAEPIELQAVGHLGTTGVDEYTAAVLKFPGDIIAQLSAGVQVEQENTVRIYGTKGHIHLPTPWAPARNGGMSKFFVHHAGEEHPQEIVTGPTPFLYSIEADLVAESIPRRQAAPPAMSWDDTLGNMRTLDQWRKAIGLRYRFEA
ncbi:MAG: oxidoreductase domain protein [Phycisphaerales bacterium]|nr:oxidoreductase domain protein [Phycisphaerales bacterium]